MVPSQPRMNPPRLAPPMCNQCVCTLALHTRLAAQHPPAAAACRGGGAAARPPPPAWKPLPPHRPALLANRMLRGLDSQKRLLAPLFLNMPHGLSLLKAKVPSHTPASCPAAPQPPCGPGRLRARHRGRAGHAGAWPATPRLHTSKAQQQVTFSAHRDCSRTESSADSLRQAREPATSTRAPNKKRQPLAVPLACGHHSLRLPGLHQQRQHACKSQGMRGMRSEGQAATAASAAPKGRISLAFTSARGAPCAKARLPGTNSSGTSSVISPRTSAASYALRPCT